MLRNQIEKGEGTVRAAFEATVVAEQIRLLLNNPADVPINLINAGIVGAMLWKLYPTWVWALWLGSFCIVSLARARLRHHYGNATCSAATAMHWGSLFTSNAFVTACLWGLTGSVVLMTPDPVYHLFIVFVLGGTMAGGVVCTAAYMPTILAFMLPIFLPTIAALVIRGGMVQIKMAIMLTLFTAALTLTGRSINRSIIENFQLRIRQDILLAKLRVSEAAMAEAQETAHVGSWDIDLKTHRDVWSMETFRVFGVDPAKFTPSYEAMLARVHPDDRSAVEKGAAEIRAGGTGRGIDHRLVMDDGAIKYVQELGRVTYDATGYALRMSGTVQDVTERKQAANALVYRERLLHAVTVCTGILVKTESIEHGMPEALRIVGENMQVDRVLVMREPQDQMSAPALSHVWQTRDIRGPFDFAAFRVSASDLAALTAWRAQMNKGKPVIAQLATSEGPVRAMLEYFQNQSTLQVPIFVGDKIWGNLGIDSCSVAREWTGSEIDTLQIFADITGSLISRNETRLSLERAHGDLVAANSELKRSIVENQTLKGLLPMCAWCKQIREPDGQWIEFEGYIHKHSGVSVTHGMCPACAKQIRE